MFAQQYFWIMGSKTPAPPVGTLQWHYDAMNVNGEGTPPIDGPLDTWVDLSPHVYNQIQESLFSRPTFLNNAHFGVPGVVFNGSNNFMHTVTSLESPFTNFSNAATIYVVQLVNNVQSSSAICSYIDDSSDRLNIHLPEGDNNIYWDFGNINTTGRISAPWTDSTGTLHVYAFTASALINEMVIYDDGVVLTDQATSSTVLLASDIMLMGVSADLSSFFDGTLFEVIGYNGVQDATTVMNTSNTLLAKWSL